MKTVVNLLPPINLRRQLARRRAVQWGAALGIVLLAIWCGRWIEMREFYTLRRAVEAATREAQPAQVMLREITTMRKQIDDLREYEAVAQELEHQRHVLPVLGLVSHAAKFSDGKLRVLKLQCEELQSVGAQDDNDRNDKSRPGAISLTGIALDSPAVAEFHDQLVQSNMFADVKLIKSNEQKSGGTAMYDYEVSCEL